MQTRTWLAAVAGVLVGLACVRGDEPGGGELIRTRYAWQAGMTTYYRCTTKSESRFGEGDRARVSNGLSAYMMRQEVYGVKSDGTARLAITLTRVRTESQVQKGEVKVFDSAEPEKGGDQIEARVYGAIVGKMFVVEMTPEGRTLRQEGVSEMFEAILKDPALKDSPVKDALRKSLDQLIANMSNSEGLIPSPGHRVGEEWTVEKKAMSMPMLRGSGGPTVFKLASVENVNGSRVATIGMTGNQDIKPAEGADGDAGMRMTMSMKTTGSTEFDLDRGRLIRSETITHVTGNTASPDPRSGKMVSTATESKITMVTELVGPEDGLVARKP